MHEPGNRPNAKDVTMRTLKLMAGLALLPLVLAAQQNTTDRLRAVLPADQADKVIAIVTDATNRGLPGQAIADRALETVAKSRSGADAVAAAQALATDLAGARDALSSAGRTPDASEIEAGATAKGLGVDGATIGALASSAPSGRSLTVPLTVIGALVDRGLPSHDALQSVLDRLTARASDAQLAEMPGEAGRLIAAGYRPSDVGRALGAGRPSGLPANGGRAGARPTTPGHPGRP
jgi:hypothetical protein